MQKAFLLLESGEFMESSCILRNKAEKILHKYSLLESEELGRQLLKSEEQFDLESLFQQGRGDIVQHSELDDVKKTKRILSEMEPCIEDLQHLKQEVESISEGCAILASTFVGKEKNNREFVKHALQVKSLISEKEGKKRILERMTSLLFLKTKDEEALQGRVSEEFFSAVDALHSATARVSKLVRETNSSLGFELLEYYANRKGLVSEKCYSYVRGTIDNLQDFELSGNELFLLQKAFSFLCEQPALFESCLLEMANVLRGKTLEYFVQSLTNYTLNIGPVQDPERYVNDMLAFIHHIFASQYEFLSSVLQGIPSKFTVANPETVEAADQGDFNVSSQFLISGELEKKILSVVSEGLCLPFQRRFEKSLSPRLTVIVLFKLSSLLEFYSQLFENILGKDSPFVRTLLECSAQSMSYFFQIWKEKFDAALENMPLVDEELNPPLFVYQCTSRISEILDTLDMSLLSDEKKEGHAESILSVVIEQLLNFCFQSSQQLDNLNAKVFIINCLESIRVPLVKYKFAASQVESITREIDRYLDLYVEYVTKASLEQSGLLEKLLRLQSFSSEEVTERIASIPGMDAESIAFVLKNFYMSILSEMEIEKLLNPPSSSKLASTRMRSRVKIAISESLISAYDTLFTLLNDPKNGYEEDATRKMDKELFIFT